MPTALTPGYVYFIESDGVTNDDWIGDHAGDPDDIDLDPYVEGTHYCKILIPKGWRIIGHTGTLVTTLGGSVQYSQRSAKRWYSGGANGILTTIANANLMDKFFMSDRHTSGASATFEPYYLIPYHGLNSSNLVPKFTDHTNTQRAYCLIEALDFQRGWVDVENLIEKVNIRFVSVWRTV